MALADISILKHVLFTDDVVVSFSRDHLKACKAKVNQEMITFIEKYNKM